MSYSAQRIEAYERKPVIHPYTPQHSSRSPHPPFRTPQQNDTASGQVDPNDTAWTSQQGFPSSSALFPRFSQWSEEKVATLQARLSRKLGPEYVTQRPGPSGGPKLSYIEGWKVINLANEVFGFNGWSSSIVSLTTDFLDQNDQGRVSVNVTAIVRITLQDGCSHEDVGCGQGENVRGKGAALDKAKKEAVTDATKRALKTFGNVLGNCLYDKEYAKEVVKVKIPPAKFVVADLERRPEFTEAGAGPSRASAIPSHMTTGVKPPLPNETRPQARELSVATPETPLRSAVDIEEDALADESFDGEFVGIGDAFFPDADQSVNTDIGAGTGSAAHDSRTCGSPVKTAGPSLSTAFSTRESPVQASGPSLSAVTSTASDPRGNQPKYQHRHRPDLNAAQKTAPNQLIGHSLARQAHHSSTLLSAHQQHSYDGLGMPINMIGEQGIPGGAAYSSGDSNETLIEDCGSKTAAGGFAYPTGTGGLSNTSGQSARAIAIADALAAHAKMSPIRSESPQIPSGSVDAVVAKASTVMRVHKARLELEENESDVEVAFDGFASARGIKRSISGETSTKSFPQFHRNGPRKALGEIQLMAKPQQDDWGGKRQRAI